MYDFFRGPLLWFSFILFIGGVIYRTVQLFILTRKKKSAFYTSKSLKKTESVKYSDEEQKIELLVSFQNTLIGKHPVMAIISTIFHFCLFITPVFLAAHNLVFYESWGFSIFTLSDSICDILTVIFLLCSIFFLIRRLVINKVQAITTVYDYFLLIVTAAPFLTGYFAYHQWFDYNLVLTIHILTGEIMLMAIPFTKLGHMVFFFFVRILVGGEYGFRRGTRTWAT
jgi:nitrate reductase gamma subunit